MPNRRFQSKDAEQSDFIYVDLLPDMRRPRQFNVNIILIVLVAVFFTWLLVYWPLSGRQNQLDEALNLNNDLTAQRDYIESQIDAYRIDRDRIDLLGSIETALDNQLNMTQYHSDLVAAIQSVESDARIRSINYNASNNTITLRVNLQRSLSYENVNIAFLDLEFVANSSYTQSNQEFILEVSD